MEGWLTLCFIALSTSLALWFSFSKSKPKTRLPPGPWTLPIIGSLHHVVSALPHHTITELSRRYGPMMSLKLGEVPTVVLSSTEAVAQVMKTNDVAFSSRLTTELQHIVGFGGNGIIFAPYGDHWRQMRKVCVMELLNSKQVKRMEGIRAEEVGSLLRSIITDTAAGATVNISQKAAAHTNAVVTRAVFGGKFARQEEYVREINKLLELLAGFNLVDLFPSSRLVRWFSTCEHRTKKSCNFIQQIITGVLDERKVVRAAGNGACSTDDEDLLDVLLRLQEEDSPAYSLTTENITTVLFDIFAAGTDTTAITLGWAMSELIRNPEVMAKAQLEVREVLGHGRAIIGNSDLAELHYLRMVIKEVLRLHPPGVILPRKILEDCKIMGYNMVKDTNIHINVFAISRDPRYWNNPEEFNPGRFENNNLDYNGTSFEFTPFGGGRRQCPGKGFATALLEITLANFLYHFDWMLPGGASPASLDMSEKFGFTVGRMSNLHLRAIPHSCSTI